MEKTAAILTHDPEASLWLQYKSTGDTDTRNRIVLRYEGLVKGIALQLIRNRAAVQNLDDLISEGLIALIDAVQRYDPSYQTNFKLFASIKIKGAMLDFFRKETPGYRRGIAQKIHTLKEAQEALTGELLREPTPNEMAARLGLSLEEYNKEVLCAQSVKLVSLEQLDFEQDTEDCELFDMDIYSDPATLVNKKELEELLASKIALLNREQQLILSLFYSKGLKINEVAQALEMDPVRVSQIRYQAVRRLKRSMKNYMEES